MKAQKPHGSIGLISVTYQLYADFTMQFGGKMPSGLRDAIRPLFTHRIPAQTEITGLCEPEEENREQATVLENGVRAALNRGLHSVFT